MTMIAIGIKLAVPAVIITFFTGTTLAGTVTATCGEPTGRAIGVIRGSEKVDSVEGISGGTFTISWPGGRTLTITSREAMGGVNRSEGTLIGTDDAGGGQIHFYEPDRGEIWFYTLFLGQRRLLISAHQALPALLGGGAVGKVMQATCSVSKTN